MLIVQKFGGSSLADAERMRMAAQKTAALHKAGHKVVTVVSAQGDTTDALLGKAGEVAAASSGRELDALLATGELQSAALMAMALGSLGIPAVSLSGWQAGLTTDHTHGNARLTGLRSDRILRELSGGKAVVVAGFQGMSGAGDVTTLGRGGSDTTAVALAAWLGADKCLIYTDVDGVYDKDPRKHGDAVRFDHIDYDRMLTLARGGAQVLHDRCVELAKKHGVAITVLSSFREGGGTVVGV
jgi:aspartate kinase